MSASPPLPAASPRSVWVDNLRTLVILLVVNMHACVTYSHVGDWYVMESPEPDMLVKVPFIFWQGHLQSFFMGLLFFLAGVFSYRSLERRGPGAFLRERLVRLGLPALLYMLVIHPFMVYVLLGHPHIPDRPSLPVLYGRYLTSERVLSGSGPLWFALALLVFSVALAGFRTLLKPTKASQPAMRARREVANDTSHPFLPAATPAIKAARYWEKKQSWKLRTLAPIGWTSLTRKLPRMIADAKPRRPATLGAATGV